MRYCGHSLSKGETEMKSMNTLRQRCAVVVVIGLLAGSTVFADTFQVVPMNRIDGEPLPPWAEAVLQRSADSVTMTMYTRVGGEFWNFGNDSFLGPQWKPGDAVTNWWAVFNNPEYCTVPCGRDDLFAGGLRIDLDDHPFFDEIDGTVGLIFATGHTTTSGTWSSSATLAEGDVSGVLFGVALGDAETAEIHVVVRSHGPEAAMTLEEAVDAVSSIGGGCSNSGARTGPNICGDPQDAIFPPLP